MAAIVAITSCPTGIAHTFMAAEGLEQAAVKLGHTIKVETQGSVGTQNSLTDADVAADVVLIAADTTIDKSRFGGKRIYETGTKAAINDGTAVVQAALQQAAVGAGEEGGPRTRRQGLAAKAAQSAARTGAYKHLMTGVSYMIPFVVRRRPAHRARLRPRRHLRLRRRAQGRWLPTCSGSARPASS